MQIKREFEVAKSLPEVKGIIEKIVSSSKSMYQIKSKNDMLNIYTIIIVAGLSTVNMQITLSESGEKTKCVFEIVSKPSNNLEAERFGKYQDQFLDLLSKGLSGQEINHKLVKSTKSGCFGISIAIVASGTLIALYLLS